MARRRLPWSGGRPRGFAYDRSVRVRARFYEYSRGSAMECGALFDVRLMELIDVEDHSGRKALLGRIVSMLSKMC